MGYYSGHFTGHDFRATASTLLHELGYRDELVEMRLAHAKADKTAAAYNHAQYLPERTAMMQAWADWLDQTAEEENPTKQRSSSRGVCRSLPSPGKHRGDANALVRARVESDSIPGERKKR